MHIFVPTAYRGSLLHLVIASYEFLRGNNLGKSCRLRIELLVCSALGKG